MDGLRCVYHGWKFDVRGTCVDMPTEPADSPFRCKIRLGAYPCVERNGVVWVYMGTRTTPPPLPDLEPNLLSLGAYAVTKAVRECNWMQALEGDLDTAHVGFLHLGGADPEALTPGTPEHYVATMRSPRGYETADTEFGTSYAAHRPVGEEQSYWRLGHFLFPCYTILPAADLRSQILVRCWVPVDDENTMFWSMVVPRSLQTAFGRDKPEEAKAPGLTLGISFLPDAGDWRGCFRSSQNKDNDYRIDRRVQATGSFTGIEGIFQQDAAVTESMGPIVVSRPRKVSRWSTGPTS